MQDPVLVILNNLVQLYAQPCIPDYLLEVMPFRAAVPRITINVGSFRRRSG